MTLYYAKVINQETGLCEVGLGTNSSFYKSIGMVELNVQQSDIDNNWYLSEKCPMKTDEQKKQKDEHIAEIEQRIKELNAIEHREADDEFKLYSAKLEYNILKGISAIYHVGGKTLTEKMSRERLVDDAIRACKSAIENGYVPGGNLIVPKVIRANKKKLAKFNAEQEKAKKQRQIDLAKYKATGGLNSWGVTYDLWMNKE